MNAIDHHSIQDQEDNEMEGRSIDGGQDDDDGGNPQHVQWDKMSVDELFDECKRLRNAVLHVYLYNYFMHQYVDS